MIDKTMLELVDRLVATNNRAAKAETMVGMMKAQLEDMTKTMEEATKTIHELNEQIRSLKNDIEIKDDTICRQYAAKEKLKERIKELEQNDTNGN